MPNEYKQEDDGRQAWNSHPAEGVRICVFVTPTHKGAKYFNFVWVNDAAIHGPTRGFGTFEQSKQDAEGSLRDYLTRAKAIYEQVKAAVDNL